MTTVNFLNSGKTLCGFVLSGHSTNFCDDVVGKTVCSAISSAAYLTANTITEIIGDKAEVEVQDGMMHFCVNNPSERSLAVLKGFKLHITELKKQYGERIEIITEV